MGIQRLAVTGTLALALALATVMGADAAHAISCGTDMNADGTPAMVVCENGKPNAAIAVRLRRGAPQVMRLTRTDAQSAAIAAACADSRDSSTPMVVAALQYQAAKLHWDRAWLKTTGKRLALGTLCDS